MKPTTAFTLVEVLLATALGMLLSGLAITALMASQKSVKATSQLMAQTQAIRQMMTQGMLAARRSAPFESQPCGAGVQVVPSTPPVVTTTLDAPSATLSATPLRTYGTSLTVTRVVDIAAAVDPFKVSAVGDPLATGGQGILNGKTYRILTLAQPITMASGQPVVVLDLANAHASSHLTQVWRQTNGPYQFTSSQVYLENTATLNSTVADQTNLYFGSQFRFIIPIL